MLQFFFLDFLDLLDFLDFLEILEILEILAPWFYHTGRNFF